MKELAAQHKHTIKNTVATVVNAKNSMNNNNYNNKHQRRRRRRLKYYVKATAVEIANAKAQLIAETTKPKTMAAVTTTKMTTNDGPIM